VTAWQALAAYCLASLAFGSLVGHYLAALDGDVIAANRLRFLGYLASLAVRCVAVSAAVAAAIGLAL
jgi:hypothetical protein